MISRCVWRTDIVLLWLFAYGNTSSSDGCRGCPLTASRKFPRWAAGQQWGCCRTVDQPRENIGRIYIMAVRKICRTEGGRTPRISNKFMWITPNIITSAGRHPGNSASRAEVCLIEESKRSDNWFSKCKSVNSAELRIPPAVKIRWGITIKVHMDPEY
jgi:hypothetical protein